MVVHYFHLDLPQNSDHLCLYDWHALNTQARGARVVKPEEWCSKRSFTAVLLGNPYPFSVFDRDVVT